MGKIHNRLLMLMVAVVLFQGFFSSCKAPKEMAEIKVKPVSTSKLLKKVEENAFHYDHLSIKRINCQFSSDQSKASFKINLKAIRDEKILVAISKMNIPVGRVLLTPDSVVYVNYIDRNYFVDDYTFLSKFLNIDLDFLTIQSIISNNAFSYRNDPRDKDFRTFDTYVEDGMLVLQSEKPRKISKIETKGKAGKIERRLKRLDDEALILQRMFFNPETFALMQLVISDKTNNRHMQMNFGDFVKIDKKDYPGTINMDFLSDMSKVELRVKMSGFSTEKIQSIRLNIPQKYEEVYLN